MTMKVLRLTAAFILLLLAVSALSVQTQPSRSDVQSWNDVQLTVPVTKTVDFVLLGTVRVNLNFSRPGLEISERLQRYFLEFPKHFSAIRRYTSLEQDRIGTTWRIKL
jgi:hypothetical protein